MRWNAKHLFKSLEFTSAPWWMNAGGHLLRWQDATLGWCCPMLLFLAWRISLQSPGWKHWLAALGYTDDSSVQIRLIWGTRGKGNPEFPPQFWESCMVSWGLFGVCWRIWSYPAFTHDPSRFSYTYAPLNPSIHCLREFLWSLLKGGWEKSRIGTD